MTPPINIDGTNENYSNVTIDGQDVEQITIDGQDVLSTIPDSIVSQYNALDGFSASDEGTSVSSWTDEQGAYNISTNGGSADIIGSGINGKRSVDFGSSGNVEFQTTSPSISQPFTVICLVEYKGSLFEGAYENGDAGGGSTRTQIAHGVDDDSNDQDAVGFGAAYLELGTSVTDTPMILSGVFDGTNSKARRARDGASSVDSATGDAGTNDANGWTLGSVDGVAYHTGYAGVYLIFDGKLTDTQLSKQESRIASEWGLSGGWT